MHKAHSSKHMNKHTANQAVSVGQAHGQELVPNAVVGLHLAANIRPVIGKKGFLDAVTMMNI